MYNYGRPDDLNFNSDILGSEDCLFLNVFTPANASRIPVFVWIRKFLLPAVLKLPYYATFLLHARNSHKDVDGGGYGQGQASTFDFSFMQQGVQDGFVSVIIQYRLGAFGFLASDGVANNGGLLNAGLQDMRLALQWVQKYVDRFGGDPDQVTIAGESAGGGAVMMMVLANGGNDGTTLFRRAIASSPYLPTQRCVTTV
jgi:carboxylesterase type B